MALRELTQILCFIRDHDDDKKCSYNYIRKSGTDLGKIWQRSPLLGARKLAAKKTFSCEKQTCICHKKTLICIKVNLLQFSGSLSCNEMLEKSHFSFLIFFFSPCLTNKSQHARPWSTAAILFVTLLWWSSTQILGYCRPNYFSRSALESYYVFCVCNVCLILCVFLPTLDGIAAAAAAYRRPSCDLRGGIYG